MNNLVVFIRFSDDEEFDVPFHHIDKLFNDSWIHTFLQFIIM